MPPRRPRPSTATKPSQPPKKRTKRDKELPSSLPQRPQTDTYTPPSTVSLQTRDAIAKGVQKRKGELSGRHQLSVSLSITEAAIVQEQLEELQKTTGSLLVISDAMEGSIEREISVTGAHKEVVHAIALISLTLSESVNSSFNGDTQKLHTTLLVPSSTLSSLSWINEEEQSGSIDVSEEFVPFSNYTSIYVTHQPQTFIPLLFDLLKEIFSNAPTSDTISIAPDVKVPLTGTRMPLTQRSETNQKQLDRSKTSWTRYLNQDPTEDLPELTDPQESTTEASSTRATRRESTLITSKRQIREAIQSVQLKLKSLESMKTTVDVPVDHVSGIIGKGGSKINEIRQRSSCNVTVDDSIKDGSFRVVTITGLPEGNLIALQYLSVLVQ